MMNWMISSSVLIFVVIALRFFLKGKISLRLQYSLWALVLVRLLFPFSIGETVMSLGNWIEQASDTKEAQQVVELTTTPLPSMTYNEAYDIVEEQYAAQGVDIDHIPMAEFSETIEYEILDTMNGGYTPAEILGMIWIIGMALLSLGFIATNLHFSRRIKRSRAFLGTAGEQIEACSLESNLSRKENLLPVYQTDVVETPCLYGIIAPSIYLTMEAMTEKECLRHVLEHERTHYHHKDHIWSVFRAVCLILHWYNPLVWCAAILSRNDAELACDEATIKRLGEEERAAYGRTLIGLTCEKRPAVLLTATTMTGSGKSIKERITLIAKKPKMATITLVVVILFAMIAVGVTYTGAKLQYASFSEWADALNPEELQYFEVSKGNASEKRYYLPTDEEFAQFCELLQSIPEEDCYRRKETVDVYEDYLVWFLCGENEVLLKCLEDETVLYVGSTEMPEFAPEGKVLIIDSPELWNYIVDTVDEKGTLSEVQEDEQEKIEQCIYKTTADLNHDGVEDSVRLMTYGKESSIWQDVDVNGVYVKVFLGTASGSYTIEPVYTSDFVASSHGANGTYVLTEKDGKDYLVYSLMYEMQGNAGYTYSVMCFEGSEMVTIQTDEVNFYCDPYNYRYWEGVESHREDVIPKFKEGLEPWIENATILVSFDVSTPDFIASYSYDQIPASSYYDMVWARDESDEIKEFEDSVGKEGWKRFLYWSSASSAQLINWVEKLIASDYSKWYTDYNGSKLQRVDGCDYSPTSSVIACGVPASCDTIYYRADAGEDERDALYKMIEKMIQARMERTNRTYIITDYDIPEQEIIPVTQNMWIVKYIQGYYAYEGFDLGTMEERINAGEPVVTEDGLIPFAAQGDDEVFIHILIEKDGVYRLQRLQKMMN